MLKLLQTTFKQQVETQEWQEKLKAIFPAYGRSLNEDAALTEEIRAMTSDRLQLSAPATAVANIARD